MKTAWVVDRYMLDRAEEQGCASIADAVVRAGLDIHVTSSVAANDPHGIDIPDWGEERPVVAFGSFRFIRQIAAKRKTMSPWSPGTFARIENLSYSAFGAHLGGLLLNDDFIMLPFGEFKRRGATPWDGGVFLRPDGVTKSFAGTVIPTEDFEHEVNALVKIGGVSDTDIVVASRERRILKETRYVIVDGRVVTGSTYGWNDNADIGKPLDDVSGALAAKVAGGGWQPDRAYTCDVALTEVDGAIVARVIELNSFSCAGLYASDLDRVVEAVSAAAASEWADWHGMD